MAQCISELLKDLEIDCEDKFAGVETEIILVNRADIDKGATVVDGNKIKSLVLKQGKTGYKVTFKKEGQMSVTSKPEFSDDDFNGHKHAIALKIQGKTAEDYQQIDNLVDGASLVAIVQNKVKNNENTFDVYGYYIGLEATEGEGRTNGGVYNLTIGTPNNQKEPYSAMRWIETDYATTKAKFDKKLVG